MLEIRYGWVGGVSGLQTKSRAPDDGHTSARNMFGPIRSTIK